MAIPRTSLLDLPLPVTGSLSGDWGAATNNGLTEYLDIAVAGSLVLNTDADVTLTSTDGDENGTNIGSTTAQYAILRWTATGSTTRNITVPAKSKTYIVINATGGTQSIVLRGAGPTTGVTIVSGEKAVCAWNGSDFVKVGGAAGGTNTQVQYNNNGVFGGSADLTWDGSTLATTGLTASGAVTLSATSQNIALGTSQVGGTWTAGGASQTGAITLDQSTKTHTLNIGTGATENALTKTINLGTAGVSGSTTAINIGSAVSGATTNVTLNGTVQPGVVISGSSSGDALRITQTGAGNALLVEDAANPDSTPFVVTAAGDVGIGTSSPSYPLHVNVTGNGTKARFTNGTTTLDLYCGGTEVYTGTAGASTSWAYANANTHISGYINGTERMRLDSSGNLGLGVTPSAWGSGYKALQINNGSLVTNVGGNFTAVTANAYYDTSYKYVSTAAATLYRQNAGAHDWNIAPSGTVNTAITFTQAMTLDASGNLVVGNTTANRRLELSSASADYQMRLGAGITNSNFTYDIGRSTVDGLLYFYGNQSGNTGYVFGGVNGERARITSGGDLLVGTTTATSALTVEKGANNATNGLSLVNNNGSDGNGSAVSFYGAFGAPSVTTQLLARINGFVIDPNGAKNGNIAFFTGSGGTVTERARITSGGDLVIGATSTSQKLRVYDSGSNTVIRAENGTSAFEIQSNSNDGYINMSGTGNIVFRNGSGFTERARITSGGYFKASDDGAYVSSTGAYHELRNTGNSQAAVISCSNASFTSTVAVITASRITTNSTYNLIDAYNGDTSGRFIVRDSGNAVNTSGTYGQISDAKMKTDIVDAGSQWADIKAIRFRKFKMKNDPSGLLQLGVVAQELEQTSPGLVDEHVDRDAEGNDLGTTTKSVKTSILLMKAAKALQEAMTRIETLEAKVAALEGTQP